MSALSQIFCFAQLVMSNRLYILDGLLNNNCFWEGSLKTFRVYCSCSLIWCDSFAITKHMLVGIYVPVVLAFVLDTCSDVAVSFLVHFCELWLLFRGAVSRKQ